MSWAAGVDSDSALAALLFAFSFAISSARVDPGVRNDPQAAMERGGLLVTLNTRVRAGRRFKRCLGRRSQQRVSQTYGSVAPDSHSVRAAEFE